MISLSSLELVEVVDWVEAAAIIWVRDEANHGRPQPSAKRVEYDENASPDCRRGATMSTFSIAGSMLLCVCCCCCCGRERGRKGPFVYLGLLAFRHRHFFRPGIGRIKIRHLRESGLISMKAMTLFQRTKTAVGGNHAEGGRPGWSFLEPFVLWPCRDGLADAKDGRHWLILWMLFRTLRSFPCIMPCWWWLCENCASWMGDLTRPPWH